MGRVEDGLARSVRHVRLGRDLPLDQQRGPLAGRVQGTFGDSFINVVAANVRWVI